MLPLHFLALRIATSVRLSVLCGELLVILSSSSQQPAANSQQLAASSCQLLATSQSDVPGFEESFDRLPQVRKW